MARIQLFDDPLRSKACHEKSAEVIVPKVSVPKRKYQPCSNLKGKHSSAKLEISTIHYTRCIGSAPQSKSYVFIFIVHGSS